MWTPGIELIACQPFSEQRAPYCQRFGAFWLLLQYPQNIEFYDYVNKILPKERIDSLLSSEKKFVSSLFRSSVISSRSQVVFTKTPFFDQKQDFVQRSISSRTVTLMLIFLALVTPQTSEQLFPSMKNKNTTKKGFWWQNNHLFTNIKPSNCFLHLTKNYELFLVV